MTYKDMTISQEKEIFVFRIKDFWSAVTHFIGMVAAIIGMPILLIKAATYQASFLAMISFMIFMLSMILLYGASASYHSFHVSKRVDLNLKKIDHSSIFILIAGSYTPICLTALKDTVGPILLTMIWFIAISGIVFKVFWVTCPKWISSVMYSIMGWLCIMFLPQILNAVSMQAFVWLLVGGISYTIGAVIYALKPKLLASKSFGNHEIFHCFVLLGSLCHYIFVLNYLTMFH
jgi:channel protein, hemolysin III family